MGYPATLSLLFTVCGANRFLRYTISSGTGSNEADISALLVRAVDQIRSNPYCASTFRPNCFGSLEYLDPKDFFRLHLRLKLVSGCHGA